ncbi:MAG: hypothetical protein RhofKO_18610 [Rhodothermales bacterium]
MGHSYGGLVALYHAALDNRVAFACSSGAVCSFEVRREAGTGINMFEVVPGLGNQIETHDLLTAIATRPMLVVSATEDPYAQDADHVLARVAHPSLEHLRVDGPHALDPARYDAIVTWVRNQTAPNSA